MIEFLPQNGNNLVALNFSGKLEHEDFERLTPVLDEQIKASGGSVRLFLDLRDFDGWEDLHAMWDHFVLVKNHHKFVERIAIVGDEEWERRIAQLADRFALAEVGFYAPERHDAALLWLVG